MEKLHLLDQPGRASGAALQFAHWNQLYPVDKAGLGQFFDA